MAEPSTRDRIETVALRLVMERGYSAFAVREVADELGIRGPAVHYHFRTRSDLVVAAVRRYGRRFDAWAAETADLSAEARLAVWFAVGREVVLSGRVCALAMLSAELQAVPEAMAVEVVAVQRCFLAFYEAALAEARSAGSARFDGALADAAMALGCAVVGAQLVAQALGLAAVDRVLADWCRNLGLAPSAPEEAA